MKICPFISHMIGEDHANVLEVESGASDAADTEEAPVVVLGYDAEGGVRTKSKKTRKEEKAGSAGSKSSSHLFCLQETCRFYQSQTKACQFDTMFDMAASKSDESVSYKDVASKAAVAMGKDLDKFWKFQTKSVSELISSFGDVERRQEEALADLKSELGEKIGALKNLEPQVDLKPFREDIAKLQEALIMREDGMEDFSTTLSEIVLNVEEGIKALTRSQENLSTQVSEMDLSTDTLSSLREHIEAAIEGRLKDTASTDETRYNALEERLDAMSHKQNEMIETLKASAAASAGDGQTHQRQKDAKKLNNLGVSSFHNGDLELARDQFLESIAKNENFAEAHNNLGLVCSELGDENAASSAFSKAIEIDPELHAAYNNMGYLFYKQNSYDQAVEMYNEALGRQSDNSTAYTNLGNAYFKLGRHEDAQAAWEKALELDPTNEKAGRSLRRIEV